jgi:hypothetical protein
MMQVYVGIGRRGTETGSDKLRGNTDDAVR